MSNTQIIVLANTIKVATQTIRDIFPDDLPYLWERLAPFIETVEGCANEINVIAREVTQC